MMDSWTDEILLDGDSAIRYKDSRWPNRHPNIYSGLAGGIVRAISPHSEADPMALLIQLLVFFGNCIGRGPHWQVGDTRHALNLFVVLVGKTSQGRKGTSLDHIKHLFQLVDETWTKNHIKSGLSSGEGLKWHIRDSDTQAEGVEDKRLLIVESEFASVLKVCERVGNTLSTCIRQFWDSGNANILTKNDPIRVTDAHVSIDAHITQEELLKYLGDTEMANGFANRFLWVCVRRSRRLPFGGNLSYETLGPLIDRLREAIQFARDSSFVDAPMEFNDHVENFWEFTYNECTDELPEGFMGALLSRSVAQVRRLACLYALLNLSKKVKLEHIGNALHLWRYCRDSCNYIFGDIQGDQTADKILGALREAGPEGLAQSQIGDLFYYNKPKEVIHKTLHKMKQDGLIDFRMKTNGRPAKIWFLVDGALGSGEHKEP